MRCEICGCQDTEVIDSRLLKTTRRRRRKCLKGHYFTTREVNQSEWEKYKAFLSVRADMIKYLEGEI